MIDLNLKIPILTSCDVLVCGGGTAGIAAAVAASRHGADTVLVERWPFAGGMATAGLVPVWHRSDREKIVINGLVEEATLRAKKIGIMKRSPGFPYVHETDCFDPEGMKVVFHDMLDEAGVRTLCYTTFACPEREDAQVSSVVVVTKTGMKAIKARIVIDASGDGDIAAQLGVPFEFGRPEDNLVQGMTMMYRYCGIDEERRDQVPDGELDSAYEHMCRMSDAGELPPFNRMLNLPGVRNRDIPNMCAVAGNPLDEEELSRLTTEARRNVWKFLGFLKENIPGFTNASVEQTACSLGIRETRRIRGKKTLTGDMVLGAQKHADAIGHGIWMIDIHDPEGSGYTTWNDRNNSNMVPRGESYHIPLGMCLNDSVRNLGVVGRCASSTHAGHSSVRVQTHCMVMGQGVGTAAALALEKGVHMDEVNIDQLQKKLVEDDVYLEL